MRILLSVLACLTLAGCSRNIQNEDAVKRGVMDYLATRQGLNVSSMNVSIASMVFRQNEVDAMVVFTPKGAGAQSMTLPYTLEKKGDKWVVKPRAGGSNPHGGAGGNPHGGMGAADNPANPGGALPPGHPTVPPQSPQ